MATFLARIAVWGVAIVALLPAQDLIASIRVVKIFVFAEDFRSSGATLPPTDPVFGFFEFHFPVEAFNALEPIAPAQVETNFGPYTEHNVAGVFETVPNFFTIGATIGGVGFEQTDRSPIEVGAYDFAFTSLGAGSEGRSDRPDSIEYATPDTRDTFRVSCTFDPTFDCGYFIDIQVAISPD